MKSIMKQKLWWNTNCDKTMIVTKHKYYQNYLFLQNTKCDKTQIVKKKLNFDKPQNLTKLKIWQLKF